MPSLFLEGFKSGLALRGYMLGFIRPTYKHHSVLDIPTKVLKKYVLILVDVDNTIATPETMIMESEILEWLLKCPVKVVLLSNSPNMSWRKAAFNDLGLESFVGSCKKPCKTLYHEVVQEYGKHKMLMIGDRLLTDILFARRCGIDSVLVTAQHKDPQWYIRLSRIFEWFIG